MINSADFSAALEDTETVVYELWARRRHMEELEGRIDGQDHVNGPIALK